MGSWIQSLREVDREAVKSALGRLTGYRRSATIVALRSLFRLSKQRRMIFRNPISHIKVRDPPRAIPTSLSEQALREAQRRATSPAHRLVFALVAIHALPKEDIRHLKLDAIDLHRRRIHLYGVDRPLDDFTGQAALGWLHERQRRWPTTANSHLIVTQQTANELGPVSGFYLRKPFTNAIATLADSAKTGYSTKSATPARTRCTSPRCSV